MELEEAILEGAARLAKQAGEPTIRYLSPAEWRWLWQESEDLGMLEQLKETIRAQGGIPVDPRT